MRLVVGYLNRFTRGVMIRIRSIDLGRLLARTNNLMGGDFNLRSFGILLVFLKDDVMNICSTHRGWLSREHCLASLLEVTGDLVLSVVGHLIPCVLVTLTEAVPRFTVHANPTRAVGTWGGIRKHGDVFNRRLDVVNVSFERARTIASLSVEHNIGHVDITRSPRTPGGLVARIMYLSLFCKQRDVFRQAKGRVGSAYSCC